MVLSCKCIPSALSLDSDIKKQTMKNYENLMLSIESDLKSGNVGVVDDAITVLYWIADIHRYGGSVLELDENEPYYADLVGIDFNCEFIESAKKLLRDFIANDESEHVSSAVGILGNFQDPADKNLFDAHLENALRTLLRANGLLHQSLLSLTELSAFADGSKVNLTDISENVTLARTYLMDHGKEFHW